MKILNGNPISKGIAIGSIFMYKPFHMDIEEKYFSESDLVENKKKEFLDAQRSAKNELDTIIAAFADQNSDKAEIFSAHAEILYDEAMCEEIECLITDEHMEPISAVASIFDQYAQMLSCSRDRLLAERAMDILDVKNRIIRNYYHIPEKNLSTLSCPVIVAAHDLLPSDTATMDRNNVLGIITELGGETSHTAIIAKSYDIPAVLGISNLLQSIEDGQQVIVDAIEGQVLLNPEKELNARYLERREAFLKELSITKTFLEVEPLTKEKAHIDIGLNIGSVDPLDLQNEKYVNCVGLFRTEFLYMGSDHCPTEEEQFEAYKKILLAFKGRHVTIRTLDIGGDKTLSYMPQEKEDNPFLGNRAIRLCFSKPEVFHTQVRALLRASVYGELWIMLPMVSSLDDIVKAKSIIADVENELKQEGKEVSGNYKVGIMIEIPSIAVIAEQVVDEVDFASIGSNDLCQYLLAVDRLNPSVSSYYQSLHPAVIHMIGDVVKVFNKANKPISICGELGGNELAAPILIGMGMRTLSMSISSVAKIKQVLSTLTIEDMESLYKEVLKEKTQEAIIQCIQKRLS